MKPSWWKTTPRWLQEALGGAGYHLPGTEPKEPLTPPSVSIPRRRTTFRNMDTLERDRIIRRW